MTKIGQKIKEVFTPGHNKQEGEEYATGTVTGTYGTDPVSTTNLGAYGDDAGAGATTTTTTAAAVKTTGTDEAVCGQEYFTKVEDRPGILR
jgi:hypothetical protein